MTLRDRIMAQLADAEGAVDVTMDEAYAFLADGGWHVLAVRGYDPNLGGPPDYGVDLVRKDGKVRHSAKGSDTLRGAVLQAALAILDM